MVGRARWEFIKDKNNTNMIRNKTTENFTK
jgi:hypothetical protein